MDGRRRSGEHQTPRPRPGSETNPNVFDDEYAASLSSADSPLNVADGLRFPGEEGRSHVRMPQAPEQTPGAGTPGQKPTTQPVQMRASIQKPRLSYGQGDDRNGSSSHNGAAVATPLAALPQRTGSVASSYAPTDRGSSSQPQTHPTYPYGLYQQSTSLGRTASMATESTARPPSTVTSTLPQLPTHPYALYTQNGLDEDVESTAPDAAPAQVGFSAAQSSFHRRIGPDGEEQGIIGPDGHTEQLPPYSEYPDHPAKIAVPPVVQSEGSADATSSASASASAEQVSPSSTGSQAPLAQAPAAVEESNVSEKQWKEKTWKERRRTKVCGGTVPCWMLTVMVGCGIVIVGLIAGLIGGLLSAEKKSNNRTTVTTTLYDASRISAPTGVPMPPSGSWALPLGLPENTQSNCLTDTSQYTAWTCASNGPPLRLDITVNPPSAQWPGTAKLANIEPQSDQFSYGTQPPNMYQSNMQWVSDLDDPHSGPALHFQAYYDKLVIVEESALSAQSNKLLRRVGESDDFGFGAQFMRRGAVKAGDRPWLCYWNTTFLEGFIYMEQNSSKAASQSSAFASMHASHTTTSSGPVPSSTGAADYYNSMSRVIPISEMATFQSSMYAAGQSKAARAYDGDDDDDDDGYDADKAAQTSPPASSPTTSGDAPDSVYTVAAPGSGSSSTTYTVPTALPLFPHIVKVEERRMSMPNNNAYCTKMQLLDDGQLVVYEMPGDGSTLTLQLSEADPSGQEVMDADGVGGGYEHNKRAARRYRRMWDYSVFERGVVRGRDEPDDSCHCQWKNS